MIIPVSAHLIVAALLFTIGAVGFLIRKNVLVALMCIELMLNGVNLTFVAFNRAMPDEHAIGQIFVFFNIALAAAEAAVGLAIVISFFRLRKTVSIDRADTLKY